MKNNKIDIAALLENAIGNDVSKYDQTFLSKVLCRLMLEEGVNNIDEYLTYLNMSVLETNKISEALNISYSTFFRNSLTISILENVLLPNIINEKSKSRKKEIRIWSSACANGQEAYSIAILLEELKNNNNFDYRIFATDHSSDLIESAKIGKYRLSDIENVSVKRLRLWFSQYSDIYSVAECLKENIEFSIFDLFNEELYCPPSSIFGDFDIVVCSNLLFYYQDEYRRQIIKKISKSIARNGYLITDSAEREILINHGFKEVFINSCIFKSF